MSLRFLYVRALALFVTAGAVVWAGCDSQTDLTQCLYPVTTVESIPDTSLIAGIDTLKLFLTGKNRLFEDPKGRGLTFSIESQNDGVVDVLTWGARNEIVGVVAKNPGTATVQVSAQNDCQTAAETMFTVHVEPCPAGPDAGQADFLSVRVGDEWTYSYSRNAFVSAGGQTDHTSESGTFKLTALSSECTGDERQVRTRFEVSIDRTTWNSGDPDNRTTTEIIRDEILEWTEFADGRSHHPLAESAIDRFHPASTDTVEVDGGELLNLLPPCAMGRLDLKLTREHGIVSGYFSRCLGSVAAFDRGSWNLSEYKPAG